MDDQGPTDLSVDTQHDDMVHDAQLDYYGKRLATCSSDRTIKIFDNVDGKLQFNANLLGHQGPVWQVRKREEGREDDVCVLPLRLYDD